MKVKFNTNLGSTDAKQHGLDFKQCCAGMECEVTDSVGAALVSRGIAVVSGHHAFAAPASPAEIKAVPSESSTAPATDATGKKFAKNPHE